MSKKQYSLAHLIEATGFTARTIRYYITNKLIDGATGKGSEAVYSEETLHRLLEISELKEMRLPPTGRKLTLEEIRVELDNKEELHHLSYCEMEHLPLKSSTVFECRSSMYYPLNHLAELKPFKKAQSLISDMSKPGAKLSQKDDEQWRRVTTPDIEIHVRVPSDQKGRTRLSRIAEILDELLNRR